jgi:spore coat protein H
MLISRRSRNLLLVILVFAAQPPGFTQTTDDFFNPATVNRLDLLVNSRDWEKLKANFQLNDYYPADLRWNGQTVRNAGIRSRGLGSRSATKPGLRVDFNRYATGQSFLGLKSVVLDNLTQDASGVRERVAMRFYDRLGLPAPRETHVMLYVNEEYAGVYALVESIDKDGLARMFGAINGNVQNDGYLFEYEYGTPFFFTYPGADLEAYATLFDPVTHENAQRETLYRPIEEMFRAINESSDLVAAVSPYLDLPPFMRHVAAQNFLAQWDGILGYAGANNFYFYRHEDTTRHQFIFWDEDNAFRAVDFPILEGHDANVLMRRAMQVPALRAAYFDGLIAAASAADGWLESEITSQRALIASAVATDTNKPFTNVQFETSMNELIAFARQRGAFVRAEAGRLR